MSINVDCAWFLSILPRLLNNASADAEDDLEAKPTLSAMLKRGYHYFSVTSGVVGALLRTRFALSASRAGLSSQLAARSQISLFSLS